MSRAVNGPENRKTVPCALVVARSIVNLELFHIWASIFDIVFFPSNSRCLMDRHIPETTGRLALDKYFNDSTRSLRTVDLTALSLRRLRDDSIRSTSWRLQS